MTRQVIPLKKPDDIKRIRDAGRIAAEIFRELSSSPLDLQTTWEIDSFIDSRIVRRGARSAFKTVRGYNYASCISVNDEIVHGVPSKKRKLRAGDIVMGVNNQEVTSARQFAELVAKLDPSRTAVLLVRRGDNAQFIPVRPDRR